MRRAIVALCLLLFACQSLPEKGTPCRITAVRCTAEESVRKDLEEVLGAALASRFQPCPVQDDRAPLTCAAELYLEKKGRLCCEFSEEDEKRRAERAAAVFEAEEELTAARTADEPENVHLREAALQRASLALVRFSAKPISLLQRFLFRLDVSLREQDGETVRWRESLYACACGAGEKPEEALRVAAKEALPELGEQLRKLLAGEAIGDRVSLAWRQIDGAP